MIHEGIDVQALGALERGLDRRPDVLPNDSEIEVLTYVSRGFEEYRGFPQASTQLLCFSKGAQISMP